MSVINVTQSNLQAEVMESEQPVLLDFWASWCGPCRSMLPVVEQIARERPDLKVCKIDVDAQPELAQQFGVMTIPTFVAMKDGKQIRREVGVQSYEALLAMF